MRTKLCLAVLVLFGLASLAFAQTYQSIETINKTNLAIYFNDYLGFPYDSHGCLHLTPADIYLLSQVVPKGAPFRVMNYKLDKKDPTYDFSRIPYLAGLINNQPEVKGLAQYFRNNSTSLIAYPSLDKLLILVNNQPYAQVKALAGPDQPFLVAFGVKKNQPISWDFMLTTPTDAGNYSILRATDHYISSAYYKNTIVPFGAWLVKNNNQWVYQENQHWYQLPAHLVKDLQSPTEQQQYNYYDISVDKQGRLVSARYAGHDFGKYVLLWTKDGKNHYPEMAYAAGELLYEQTMLVKDLVHLLTLSGSDDLNDCVGQNKNFVFYRELNDFVASKGKIVPKQLSPQMAAYYKLYNNLDPTKNDYQLIDQRVLKAFEEYQENRLPRDTVKRYQALGLNHYLRQNSQLINKYAYWYEKLKKDWAFWRELRQNLRTDFDQMGVFSLPNRQNILEQWLNDRLEFKFALVPEQAKNVGDLTFSGFFKPDKGKAVFAEREKKIMLDKIRQAISSGSSELHLQTVSALNNYNFGLLLDDILGDLYKSHGCLHTSPRNSQFLYDLLPIGTRITVYGYDKKLPAADVEKIPYFAHLVNFQDDLDQLEQRFAQTAEVDVVVYPSSGLWLIYLKSKPFAKLRVRGGPQANMYLVQDRTDDGLPVFEEHLAYPTTPGTFYILKKTDHYVSNIYRDQTVMAMGGLLKKEAGQWLFENDKNDWVTVPQVIQLDLNSPEDKHKYTYYDAVKNASGEVVEVKWGSHPFGKYALQTSKDKKTPFPELIHSSGDLIMEERQLINDLIKVLAAPHDELEQCAKYSQNFDLYRTCYEFVKDPSREDLLQTKERANYRVYHGLSLTSVEVAALPPDVIVADKVMRNKQLSEAEIRLLIKEGVAYRRGGEVKLNMEKILGLQFDTYQYVVMIQKFAHHYQVLKDNWEELSALRLALLKDFNNFVIRDPQLMHNFLSQLMLERTDLKHLSQTDALKRLYEMLE
ncbi:hypothetical protein A2291_02810 [candidate division WOR-1 bacterium RIFOXYB2_FULL_42_35]|uniref:Uncharacterized protein n=1 Tax=candidate division WOR-1 bacterium RIFOXYC2_FULL_41_25 TaxID=1802586 RepID=A0A1F4TQU0_UNCSA|nr:MAG: hypothetical protein A2247_01120 [candidate division WOR-1 bacterium RIFOXYA2_FULL_41_14]OGC25683.1 MAG: hypothetical protein A2291_02810 [candidate division WOR-1 bacterium RIFOXYB2_FULL_42_35]OGC35085.1 MAG: hypothetical protein A2462_05955 [candidate division WOR-1 bacterium RIFOXYC2_FULL_41_25]OGC42412.1 MAG: hypothetical protein A2548_07540 [candidate division WOR-1 bacterium RIFOXYD2_FULL_41_8]